MSKYGFAPPRQTQRQKLRNKGYQQLMRESDGTSVFTEAQARKLVNQTHEAGQLAQSVRIAPADGGEWWVVMYRRK